MVITTSNLLSFEFRDHLQQGRKTKEGAGAEPGRRKAQFPNQAGVHVVGRGVAHSDYPAGLSKRVQRGLLRDREGRRKPAAEKPECETPYEELGALQVAAVLCTQVAQGSAKGSCGRGMDIAAAL